MRISDWSSDVCSSDLGSARTRGHGADPVTSIGLHLTPELMRMGAARPAMRSKVFGLPSTSQFAGVTFDGFEVALPLDVTEVASNGVGAGDPTLASAAAGERFTDRSEEHTSELQSLMRISYAVFCLKKQISQSTQHTTAHRVITP